MKQQVKPEIEIQSNVKYVLYFKLFTYKTNYSSVWIIKWIYFIFLFRDIFEEFDEYENYKLISCRY